MTIEITYDGADRETQPAAAPSIPSLESMGAAAVAGYYDTPVTTEEAERLRSMAECIDPITLAHLKRMLEGWGGAVVDAGAGDATNLGDEISSLGLQYVAIDKRPDAVKSHQQVGHEAKVAGFGDLGLEEGSVGAVIGRFAFAWLSERMREAAMADIMRVTRNGTGGAIIIDYDWSSSDGPELYREAVSYMQTILRQAGFDPEYGNQSAENIAAIMRRINPTDEPIVLESRYSIGGNMTIQQALPMIELTATPVIQQLRKVGKIQQADTLEGYLAQLRQLALKHPGETVSLPEIVVVEASIHDSTNSSIAMLHETLRRSNANLDIRTEDITPLFKHNGVMFGVAVGDEVRLRARQVQAASYYLDGIVDESAIDTSKGVLVAGNDPEGLVDRSDYVVAVTPNGHMNAAIRIIRDDPAEGLPSIKRLKEACPDGYNWLVDQGVMDPGMRRVEVSALAKNPYLGEFDDAIGVLVGLLRYGRGRCEYAVMDLREEHVNMFLDIFGEKSFLTIPHSSAVHSVDLPGVDPRIRFMPLLVRVDEFIAAALEHAQTHADNYYTRLMSELLEGANQT